MFQRNDVIQVCAPTGSAAFSAGGETIHRLFGVRVHRPKLLLNSTSREKLQSKFANLLVLIIDERSMLSSELFGIMEAYANQAAHNGMNPSKPWGAIPIIILVGDDYQLPPIHKGAFDALGDIQQTIDQLNHIHRPTTNQLIARGHVQFRVFAQQVMFLQSSQRVLPGQERLAQLLQGVRSESDASLSSTDIDFLATNFHSMNPHFSDEDRKSICKDALFLFANKKPKRLLNKQKLIESHSEKHPVARIKSKTLSAKRRIVANNHHYDNESTPASTSICVGATVALTGTNICPEWGLFNGSIGTVIDIIFRPHTSPNNNDLPAYILVDFALYRGPSIDPENPTYVPIVPITAYCNKQDCSCNRTFIPLKLAFAKTCHTFQGQSAGPVAPGQPPNPIKRIICDPGTKKFEGQNIGLFYTILSRVTSLGQCTHDTPISQRYKDSAIYFIGSNMNRSRITNLTRQANGQLFQNIIRRQRWVNHLRDNEISFNIQPHEIEFLFHWATNARISYQFLHYAIHHHSRSNSSNITE